MGEYGWYPFREIVLLALGARCYEIKAISRHFLPFVNLSNERPHKSKSIKVARTVVSFE